MKRPFVGIGTLYVAGILLGRLATPLSALMGVAVVILLLALCCSRARLWLLAILLVLTGWINLAQRTLVLDPRDVRGVMGTKTALAVVKGVITEAPQIHPHQFKDKLTETTTALLDLQSLAIDQGEPRTVAGRIVIQTKAALPATFFAGQMVTVTGVLGPPDSALAPGLFDYRAYLENQGVYFELKAEDTNAWTLVSSPARPPLADRFREWAREALGRGLPVVDQTLGLEWALTLGWKPVMTEPVAEPFIRASTYHIFAVDGLRVAIISGILIGLLRTLGLPRPVCGAVALPLIFFYAAMTGWPASAVRAIAMVTVVFVGWIARRPGDLVNSLAAAAVLLLVWEPRQLFQAGFQLSFLVVLCIILIQPSVDEWFRRLLAGDELLPEELRPRWRRRFAPFGRHVLDLFSVSLVAWLGSLPLVAYYFHLITPLSGPANVLAVPLCALVLIANFSSLLVISWLPGMGELFNHAGWFCMKAIAVTSQWSADWPGAYFYVPTPGIFSLVLYYGILLATLTGWLFQGAYRKWKWAGMAALILVWSGQWLATRSTATLTVLPLHGGHAIYAHLPGGGGDWLINCGNEFAVDATLKPFLRAQGVNRLDNFVLAQGEAVYSGGAAELLALFRPRNIYSTSSTSRSPAMRALQNTQTNQPGWRPALHPGDVLRPWTILGAAEPARQTKAEDNVLVLRGEFQGIRILLLSGLGTLGQRALLAGTNDLHADLVIAGPPASGEPLSERLLDAIQPRAIVIADAKDPTPRRISAAVKERLALRQIPVLFTRECDAVTIILQPGCYELHGMHGKPIRLMQEEPQGPPAKQ